MTEEMVAYAQGLDKTFGAECRKVHGRILTLGFLLSRLKLRRHLDSMPTELVHKPIDGIANALLETEDQTILDVAVKYFLRNLRPCSCSREPFPRHPLQSPESPD